MLHKRVTTESRSNSETMIVTQQPQPQTAPKGTEPTDFTPIRPQPPLPNQQDDRDKR